MHVWLVMLAALEMAWHPYFNPATANTRMDYEHPLNRPLFIALFKQTQVRALLPISHTQVIHLLAENNDLVVPFDGSHHKAACLEIEDDVLVASTLPPSLPLSLPHAFYTNIIILDNI